MYKKLKKSGMIWVKCKIIVVVELELGTHCTFFRMRLQTQKFILCFDISPRSAILKQRYYWYNIIRKKVKYFCIKRMKARLMSNIEITP